MSMIPMDVTLGPGGAAPAHTWCDCDQIVPVDGDGRLLARGLVDSDAGLVASEKAVREGLQPGAVYAWTLCPRCRERSALALARVARDFGISVEVARTALSGARALEAYAADLRAQIRLERDGLVPKSPTPAAFAELRAALERGPAPDPGTVRAFQQDGAKIPSEVIAQRVTRDLGPDSWPEVVRSERATDCPVGLACDPAEIAQRGSCASCGETTEPERR